MAEEREKLTDAEAAIIDSVIKTMIERRHELGITQRAFAEQSGYVHSSIARIESGRHIPNMVTLTKLLVSLGLTLQAVPAEAADEKADC